MPALSLNKKDEHDHHRTHRPGRHGRRGHPPGPARRRGSRPARAGPGHQSFPTTLAGYRQLHRWLASFGQLDKVGVEGTGSYGSALARHLTREGMEVIEVARPNRQVRRRYGKTDVIDAIAAARAVQSGEATGKPKSHDGPVEALRALKAVQRSATSPGPKR